MAKPAKTESEQSFEAEYATLLNISRKPRAIRQARLAQSTFWPGKLGEETTIAFTKNPSLIRILWIPGDGLLLEWKDGTTYTVGASNIVGMEEI